MAFTLFASRHIPFIEEEREERFSHKTALKLPDSEFTSLFGINKALYTELCTDLLPSLGTYIYKRNTITLEMKILCALRYFVIGGYQRRTAEDRMIRISQPRVSHCISLVSEAISKNLLSKWITFPTKKSNLLDIESQFYQSTDFPGVIGAMDSLQVAIHGLAGENCFINKKGFPSINTQIICGPDLKILNVDARYPGGTKDSDVWKVCNLREAFVNKRIAVNSKSWIIGDSCYPLEPWLMTPFSDATKGTPEANFNEAHSKVLNIAKKCKTALITRFGCLKKTLLYSPVTASNIIYSCIALHNMCVSANIAVPHNDNVNFCDDCVDDDNNDEILLEATGYDVRQRLLSSHFSSTIKT